MNEILVMMDINKNDIQVSNLDTMYHNNNSIVFKATSIVDGENGFVSFNGFKFGFFVRDSADNIVSQGIYPKVGSELVSSYDSPLAVEALTDLQADETYKLQIYVEDAGDFYDNNLSFSVPTPARPSDPSGEFMSWSWNTTAKEWQAPTPMPTTGSGAMWTESTKSWTVIK